MGGTFHLPKSMRMRILRSVDTLFERLKARTLGPHMGDKAIAFSFRRDLSLAGLFEAAAHENGILPDTNLLDQLLTTSGMYLDAVKARTAAQAIHAVETVMQNAQTQGEPKDWAEVMHEEMQKVFEGATSEVHRIVASEAQQVRSVSQLDGIEKLNSALGIEDPTVFFIVAAIDDHTCDECIRLHLMPDRVTPRLWKMSQLSHDYHKRGDPTPKIGGLHPHCRCTMATLTPGFGFDKAGDVTYVGPGHDEYAKQRDLK